MKQKSLYSLCKNDIFLAAGLAASAVLLFLVFLLFRGSNTTGMICVITVEGREYGSYSLDQKQSIAIDTDRGHNLVCIEDGTVYMLEADCPDGYCIYKGKVSKCSDTIVCLPHRVVVEIRNENLQTEEFDIIAE